MGYRAFFSYARADDKIANWLHRQLDSYRTPKSMIGAQGLLGRVPAKLHPIYRDRTDQQAGGHIDHALDEALKQSETLIVLCTPTSAKSRWVNHECETFLKLGRGERIFPVIAAGEPDSGDPETECFPPALRGRGLLAADLRDLRKANGQVVGDGREGGRVKLIAGLLGVSLDTLVQRERRRQRLTLTLMSVTACVFAALAVAAVALALASDRNARAAQLALAQSIVARGWGELSDGNPITAMRYGLLAETISDQVETDIDALLGSALYQTSVAQFSPLALFGVEGTAISIYPLHGGRNALIRAGDDAENLTWLLVSVEHGRIVRELPMVSRVEVAPDRQRFVAVFADGTVSLRSAEDGEPVWLRAGLDARAAPRFVQGSIVVGSLVLDPRDGSSLREISVDGELTSDGRFAVRQTNWSNIRVTSVSVPSRTTSFEAAGYAEFHLSPSGDRILTVSGFPSTGTDAPMVTEIWSMAGARLASITGDIPNRGLAMSEFGSVGAVCRSEGSAVIVNLTNGRVLRTIGAHSDGLEVCALSDDGGVLATAGRDQTRLWNLANGEQLATFYAGAPIVDVAFTENERTVLVLTRDARLSSWRIPERVVSRIRNEGDPGADALFDGEFGPQRNQITVVGQYRDAETWDISAPNARLVSVEDQLRWRERHNAATSGREDLRAEAVDGVVLVGPPDGSRSVVLDGHAGEARRAQVSPDRSLVATSGSQRYALLWDWRSGRQLARFENPTGFITVLAFDYSGERLLILDDHGNATVWDIRELSLRGDDLRRQVCWSVLDPRSRVIDPGAIQADAAVRTVVGATSRDLCSARR